MRHFRWTACLWPGYVHLWTLGSWWALGLACSVALLVNVLLVSTFLWTEWLPRQALLGGWLLAAAAWVVSTWLGRRLVAGRSGAETEDSQEIAEGEDLFRQAQAQYLQGNWFEAESLLLELIERNRADVEGRLLLTTLFRHTGRSSEAMEQIERLSRMEAAESWSEELGRLREAIDGMEVEEQDSIAEAA